MPCSFSGSHIGDCHYIGGNLHTVKRMELVRTALVIGGGVAGMVAARSLADLGYPVHLVERDAKLGGKARRLSKTWRGEDIREFQPEDHLFGHDPRVMTHQQLDERLAGCDPALRDIQSAVFIQCVGSREPERPSCSRVRCTHTVESALELKHINPAMDVYVLYRDLRTCGERELLCHQAKLKSAYVK
ncbi:MAG: NAD(P)-binding protein [Desulfobacteraceae bacterium]|nr:NAD(P)-binding protein [Desulfobacteraceae bacterium]